MEIELDKPISPRELLAYIFSSNTFCKGMHENEGLVKAS